MNELNNHIEQIKKLCAINKVKSLFAFGSIVKNKLTPQSDIDLVVEIDDQDPISYSDKYFSLKFELGKLLKRQIDLLESKAIKNQVLKTEIDKNKILIYGN